MAHDVAVKWMYGGSVEEIQIHKDYPVLSYFPGSMKNVLDKCLVTGFGEMPVTSIVIDSSGRATVNCVNHGIVNVPVVMRITGSIEEAINGDWWVDSISTNSYTFDATDSGLTSVTCLGNITSKVAPLDWLRKFDFQNTAVFQSKDPTSRRFHLRIDDSKDSSYYWANVAMYENMSSVDDVRSVKTPRSEDLRWYRHLVSQAGIWSTNGMLDISWSLIGTSKQFCFSVHSYYGNNQRCKCNYYFGDANSFFKDDYGANILTGTVGASSSATSFVNWATYTNLYLSRNSLQKISTECQFAIPQPPATTAYFSNSSVNLIPDDKNFTLFLNEPIMFYSNDDVLRLRGEIPGMAHCSNYLSDTYNQHEIVYFDGTPYMFFHNAGGASAYFGHFFFNMKSWDPKL